MTSAGSVDWRPVHDLIPYVPEVDRTRIEWPGGARIAFWLVPNIEHYELMPLPDPAGSDPWPRSPHPDVLGQSYTDYGNRSAFWRMLEVIDEYAIPCTTSLNFAVLDHYPEIRDAMFERGWDWMSHGVYNTRLITGYTEAQERAFLRQTQAIAKRHGIDGIPGMLGPYISATPRTPALMAQEGFRYWADLVADDVPAPLRVPQGRLVALPYTYELNDGPALRRGGMGADDFVRLCLLYAEEQARRAEDGGRVMCVAVHPFAIAQPHRIGSLRSLFEALRARDDVWFATASEITDHYLEHYYDTDARQLGLTDEVQA
jgi:allantoinase